MLLNRLPHFVYVSLFFGPTVLHCSTLEETSVFMKVQKNHDFDDKIIITNITGSKTTNLHRCVSYCASQNSCLSIFFNKNSRLCQTHDVVFTDPTPAYVSTDTSYYYIIHGNHALQPIKYCEEPLVETGVTWSAGPTYIRSRRQLTCSNSFLPAVLEVECLNTGNWTRMSAFCRDIRPETCNEVKQCSSTNGDDTYVLYPPSLSGNGIQVYCHNMASTNPKAYITLFELNQSRNDFSRRTSSSPCQFLDRDGDAWAIFNKISVDLTDMSVDPFDFTFADTYQETTRSIPGFGRAMSCSFDYVKYPGLADACPAPGFFIINTNGTGLKVDPGLTWQPHSSYGPRIGMFERSTDGLKIEATYDAYCGSYRPAGTMYLHYDANSGIRGTATTPLCPDM